MSALDARARYARLKSEWYAGEPVRHPHGDSAKDNLLPRELTANCWDVSPEAWRFSEWGNAAGKTDETAA